jgi:hypothetical protein
MPDKIFVNGLRIQKPRDNAPDFVKANISINREELLAWLNQQTGEWINAQALDSKNKPGNWYVEVDTWEPTKNY